MTEGACPFCDVAADRCFYQGERVVGLWDAFPVSDGHALFVTRRSGEGNRRSLITCERA